MEEHNKTNQSNHGINSNMQSFEVDPNKQQCTTEDTKENELFKDDNISLNDKFNSSLPKSAENTSILKKPYAENLTKDTQSITEENEHVMRFQSIMEEHKKTKVYEATRNMQSGYAYKQNRRYTTQDTKENEFFKDETVPLVDKSNPSSPISAENTSILSKPFTENLTKDAHSIKEENEHVIKFQSVMEEHKKTKVYEANRNMQSGYAYKHNRGYTTQDTNENELFNVANVLLVDKSNPSDSSSAVNTSFLLKSHEEDSTKYGKSITEENEPWKKFSGFSPWVILENVRWYFANFEENMAYECTEQVYFPLNLTEGSSNASHVIEERSNMPDIHVLRNNNQQFSEAKFVDPIFDNHGMYEVDEIKTLEDALRHFDLYYILEMLDISLEELRRRTITENDHEDILKQIDKNIQKLSNIYHPDTVMRRRGTEDEIKTAQKEQAALNAVRTVLRYLNAAFLADIRTDHKFQFYSKLNISSLCNENQVKCRIYEMKFKLSMVSRIKQQNIILQIRKFLTKSKQCVSNYIQGRKAEFKDFFYSALFHLNQCIDGFKKLRVELEEMEKQCRVKNDEHMLSFVQNMATDIKKDLKVLDLLEKSATSSIKGNYQFFSTEGFVDPYFVRPLVWYTNVMVMCKVMWFRSGSILDKLKFHTTYHPKFNEFSELKPLFYLTAYYSDGKYYENKVRAILNKGRSGHKYSKMEISKSEIISRFREILDDKNKNAEITFNIDHYTEVMVADILALEIEKCLSMMNEFEEKKEELSESIKEIQIKTEKMEENYDDIVQTSEDLNSKIEEIAETNSKIEAILEANSSKIEELLKASKKLSENSKIHGDILSSL